MAESVLPPRYWVWQTFSGCVFRFLPDEADRISTVLDEWTDDSTTPQKGLIAATDILGCDVRLRIAHLDFFYECTAESRARDLAIRKELEEENKDWSET